MLRMTKTQPKSPSQIRLTLSGLVAVLALVLAAPSFAQFYKYRDDNGNWVISHNIPNDRVKNGYLIIDDRGRVIEEVGRQLSDREYKEKIRQEAAVQACEEALNRVRNLYQNLADIDYAEGQALDAIETSIANLRANLTHIQNQKKELEAQAAQMDIAGQALPPTLLANIERAQSEESNLEDAIRQKTKDKADLSREFDYDRSVFGLEDCNEGLPAE